MNVIDRVLGEQYDQLGLPALGLARPLSTALLTPRFVTSRHIVGLVFGAGSSTPAVVAKLPRRPGDIGGVHQEAETLGALARTEGAKVRGIPQVLGVVDAGRYAVLVETALHGAPLDPACVNSGFGRALHAGLDFLKALPVTRSPENNADWYEVAVTRPLQLLVDCAPLGGESKQLVERTHEVLEPLRSVRLPGVFEHADMSHPNLLIGSNRLGVLDWERASAHGLPGHDVVFFLQYLSESVASAYTRSEQLSAFDQAFLRSGWARSVLHQHLTERGVDPELAAPLIVLTWARSTATLVPRLLSDPLYGSSQNLPLPAAQLATALSSDRDFFLWRHALDRAEVLR